MGKIPGHELEKMMLDGGYHDITTLSESVKPGDRIIVLNTYGEKVLWLVLELRPLSWPTYPPAKEVVARHVKEGKEYVLDSSMSDCYDTGWKFVTGQLFLPPVVIESKFPTIFLGGPIQGSQNWQEAAMAIIWSMRSDVNIASPRREGLDDAFVWEQQVDWETHYLRNAARRGVILFWLAREFQHSCGRPYAQTTRGELGEWRVRHEFDRSVKIIVGIEDGFSGARWIRKRLSEDQPDIPVCDSLHETCRVAVDVLSR